MTGQGEGPKLEFKSSARWNYKAQQAGKEIEDAVVKTIAGFMNSDGGVLVVGVGDTGEIVGLDRDIALCGNKGMDGFRVWLGTKLAHGLGKVAAATLTIGSVEIDDRAVCLVEASPSSNPVWATTSKGETFYVRTDNSTTPLSPREAVEYIAQRKQFGGALKS